MGNVSGELRNDQVRVRVKKGLNCQIELEVLALKRLIDRVRKETLKQMGTLKQDKPEVEMRFKKLLVNQVFGEAQKLAKIPPFNENFDFSLNHLDDTSAELIFRFESEPRVPTVDPSLFVPRSIKNSIGVKEIDQAIDKMRLFHADWKTIENESPKEGDYIVIDVDTLDEVNPTRVFHRVRLGVDKKRMSEWMMDLISKAKAGETVEGTTYPDKNVSEEERKAFTSKKVRIHLYKVERPTLPEFDQEFAKKVGIKDVDEIGPFVHEVLTNELEKANIEKIKEEVSQFLISRYEFDLPKTLIEQEVKQRVINALKDPEFKAKFEKMNDFEKEEIEREVREETIKIIRLFYLSKQIVQDHKIPIANEEIEQQITQLREGSSQGLEKEISKQEIAIATSRVLLSKAQNFIMNFYKEGVLKHF